MNSSMSRLPLGRRWIPRRHLPRVALCLGALLFGEADISAQTSPIRVCVAGLVHGHIAGFMESASRRGDIAIAGFAEADTSVSGEFRRSHHLQEGEFFVSLDAMLEKRKPEAVVVFSSTFDHRRVVEVCSRRGIPVMVEKPLAVSFEDAQAIARAAQAGNIEVLVNYETTWYPNTREVHRMTHPEEPARSSLETAGELRGQKSGVAIRKMVAHDGHRGPKEIGVGPEFLAWLTDPMLDGGGALMDFGCYGANLFTYLMDNQRPLTVTAITQTLKPDIYPHVDDDATVILTYPHAQGIIQASWNWPAGRKDLEIYGPVASIHTVGRDRLRLQVGDGPGKEIGATPLDPPEDDPLTYLAAVVRGRIRPSGLSSLENNLIVSEILEAARRSAATGTTIRLPLRTGNQ
jgi:predicted dehydrogenase